MSGFCHHAIIYFVKIHTLSDPRRGALGVWLGDEERGGQNQKER
jgi:hypothetical protein